MSVRAESGFALADAVAALFIASTGSAAILWGSVAAAALAQDARSRMAAIVQAERLLLEAETARRPVLADQGAVRTPIALQWSRSVGRAELDDMGDDALWRVAIEISWGEGHRRRSERFETILFRPNW